MPFLTWILVSQILHINLNVMIWNFLPKSMKIQNNHLIYCTDNETRRTTIEPKNIVIQFSQCDQLIEDVNNQ